MSLRDVSAGRTDSGISTAAARGGIGLYEWNPLTQETWWDETCDAIFAVDDADSSLVEVWHRRVHPDDKERLLRTFSGFSAAEDLFRVVLDDGTLRYVLSRATHVVEDADGTPTKVVGVFVDVTTTHEAGVRLTSTLESMSDGFCALDRGFRFTYVNQQAEHILGTGREHLLDRCIWDAFPQAGGTKFEDVYRRVMHTRAAESFEEYYPEPLNMWIEVHAEPASEGIAIYFRDISQRRAEQDERERLIAAERRAHRETERARREAEAARRTAEQAMEMLGHQATHDSLTGLLNRAEFERLARVYLESQHEQPVTAMFLDLDRFKLVNDSLGHAAGDVLLVEVARRLAAIVRRDHVVARLGGDEFVLLLVGREDAEAEAVATRVLAAVREPVVVDGRSLSTTASIGMAVARTDATVQTLLRDADVALYRSKDLGRDAFAWFDSRAHQQLCARVELEAELRSALVTGDLRVHYQPIFDVQTRRVTGVEALARWVHPTLGQVSPEVFVEVAEEAGLADQLTSHVLAAACGQIRRWDHLPEFRVWVNVSARQLDTPGLAAEVLRVLVDAGVRPDRLGIEVTESALTNEATAARELSELSAAGVSVAIDDFGTGYSSLARLNKLPIDVLKIDRSFVGDIETERGGAAVIAIVQLAQALGLSTVAEGIESDAQLQLVRAAGVSSAAGFHLARPLPARDLLLA